MAVKAWAPLAAGRRITPSAAGVRYRRAELRRALEYCHRAVGLGRPGQHTSFVLTIASLVMTGAFGATYRWSRQRRRGRTGIAGRIGCGRGQAVGAVRQRGRCIGPGAAAIGHDAVEQRRTVIDLDRALASAVPVSVSVLSLVMWSPDRAAVGRERGNARRHRRRRIDGHASAAEAAPVLPAASVAVAVRLWAPLASAAVV